jgi:hypothetical protein
MLALLEAGKIPGTFLVMRRCGKLPGDLLAGRQIYKQK